jgi:hypothetical protein
MISRKEAHQALMDAQARHQRECTEAYEAAEPNIEKAIREAAGKGNYAVYLEWNDMLNRSARDYDSCMEVKILEHIAVVLRRLGYDAEVKSDSRGGYKIHISGWMNP